MRRFEDYNPFVLLIYFISVSSIVMFYFHPVMILLALCGALSLFLIRNGGKHASSHWGYFVFFCVMALANLFFRHSGATVLFVINHNPVTLEAAVYGLFTAAMLLGVLYWFRTFSQVMTGDKLLYLFGAVSPKLALILSMALRYIPLFVRQSKKVNQTQRAMGIYREENLIDNIRGGLRVFSVMVTWALENGIITADSMEARGYGIGKRTMYSLFRVRRADVYFLCITLLLLLLTVVGGLFGALDMVWYPLLQPLRTDLPAMATYGAYALLVFLPTIWEGVERIRWNCLRSEI